MVHDTQTYSMTRSAADGEAGMKVSRQNRVTAREVLDGIEYMVLLERTETGCYREVGLQPLRPTPTDARLHGGPLVKPRLDPSVFLG
jgi:hypothetical protein